MRLMHRVLCFWLKLLPFGMMGIIGGCGVTDRQLADFAASSAVRVFVQTAINILDAFVIQSSALQG